MELKELAAMVQKGRAKQVQELVQQAIGEKIEPEKILNEGMISAMSEIGDKFKAGEIYVPEMLIAARAMAAGLKILEPVLVSAGVKKIGKAVLGTVHGDLHDIGKNLVGMLMTGAGIEVCDIGVDVPAATFIDKAEEIGADLICISALLTTTMPEMKVIMDELNNRGVRDKYKVMIGGAPVNDDFRISIGADYYTADAASAAQVAKQILTA